MTFGPASSTRISLEIFIAATIAIGVLGILFRMDPGGLSGGPDAYMHLVRFRDGYGIFHGGFFRRDNAPYGTVLPWTMPFDGALALFYGLGRLFAGPEGALYFAARVVSPIFCASIGPLIFLGLRPFFDLRARVVMGGMAATAPSIVGYSMPGNADHHSMILWTGVLFAIALIRYLFLPHPHYRHAAAAGLAAAFALWTSPEEFIVVGAGLSALVLYRCWVEDPSARFRKSGVHPHPSLRDDLPPQGGDEPSGNNLPPPLRGRPRAVASGWGVTMPIWRYILVGFSAQDRRTRVNDRVFCGAFALAMTAAWLINPPYEGLWALKVDLLSFVYVAFAWLFSATLMGLDLYLLRRAVYSRPRNLMVAALLGGVAFLCWVAIEPNVLKGPFGEIDPRLFPIWVDHVSEARPMWRFDEWSALTTIALILVWAYFILVWASLAVLIAKASGRRRWLWIASAILMVPVSLLGIRYIRASYYTEVFGAIPLGLVLADFTRRFPKYIGYVAIPVVTLSMLAMFNATLLLWNLLTSSPEKRTITDACSLDSLAKAIAPIRDTDAIVMTELEHAPMALYLSRHLRTVAGPFQRNTEGILDQFAFFNAPADREARALLGERGIEYVLICDTGEKRRPDSFGERILHDTPGWLQPVGSKAARLGFRLYHVHSGNG